MYKDNKNDFIKSSKGAALIWIIYIITSFIVLGTLIIIYKGSEMLSKVLFYHLSLSLIIGFFVYFISRYLPRGSELLLKLKISEENYLILAEKYEAAITKGKRNLEQCIQMEVDKKRQDDHILIQQSRLAAMGEMIRSIGHQWNQPLNNLSLLIQDVKEALDFGEINAQYIDGFTRESMIQVNQMSRTINDFRRLYQFNKEKSSFSISTALEDAL